MRVCLDLNIWIADILATRAGRSMTAAQLAVAAVRGEPARAPLQLVVSWGMLQRLGEVLRRDFCFDAEPAENLATAIAAYAHAGPTLSLGGVGVLPIHDAEDRHVLETAWAGQARVLVTADFRGFIGSDAEILQDGRLARLWRGGRSLYILHPFLFAAWLRGEAVAGFDPAS